MSKLQKSTQSIEFVDFIPAELKENKTWEVVYYMKHPITKDLKRIRHRVKPLKSTIERRKLAKRMIVNINKKLYSGWNKFIEESNTKSFAKVFDVFDTYLMTIKKQVKKETLRKDTLRSYTSFINNIKNYLIENNLQDIFVHDWNEELLQNFLDEIFFERDNSARTHNNYLRFINTFSLWMIKRKYINVNPATNIDRIKEGTKKRIVISHKDRETILNYMKENHYNYYVLCYTAFYTLIRRTEITKILVSDVFLKNRIINIRADISKNGKEQVVTIPKPLINVLIEHLSKAKNSDYLFSADNFIPGPTQLNPKKISDEWAKLRRKLKFSDKYQWYSLKDTGITNYLTLGLPLIDVKNQARHHSITQTETYTPKNIVKAVKSIESASLDF
ncbi:MAG: site-specific integrase [Tenacibaculum sp.]|nr:site-specific integrase [Tenacibaculum sp.]